MGWFDFVFDWMAGCWAGRMVPAEATFHSIMEPRCDIGLRQTSVPSNDPGMHQKLLADCLIAQMTDCMDGSRAGELAVGGFDQMVDWMDG